MRTVARAILPLLLIVLVTPVAIVSATTDAPDLVLVEVNLNWTVP